VRGSGDTANYLYSTAARTANSEASGNYLTSSGLRNISYEEPQHASSSAAHLAGAASVALRKNDRQQQLLKQQHQQSAPSLPSLAAASSGKGASGSGAKKSSKKKLKAGSNAKPSPYGQQFSL